MLFTSLEFIVYLAAFLAAYYLLPKRVQWYVLLAASVGFYALLGRRRIVFVMASAFSTWAAARILELLHTREKVGLDALKASNAEKPEKASFKAKAKTKRRIILWIFLALNFGLLFLFKFYGMAAEAMPALPQIRLLMPIGISFYTLQIAGYVMDVYNKKVKAEQSLLKTVLFTTFFPQIIEGPISRFDALAPQLFSQHSFDYDRFCIALQRMLWGYFKKLVIADRLHVAVGTVFEHYENYHGFEIAIAAVMYTIQLYADFSGGIDIAIGAGQLFGIDFAENFKRPFFSKSVSEFWRRWHITLGSWLRDYIFYPLTLSRPMARLGKGCTKHLGKWAGKWLPAYFSLFVLWLCNGIWHGDGLQFIVFGLYHGTLIMLGMTFEPLFEKLSKKIGLNRQSKSWNIVQIARTFAFVCIGELIFRSASLAQAVSMLKQMLGVWNPWVLFDGFIFTLGIDKPDIYVGIIAVAILFFVSLASRTQPLRLWVRSRELPIRWAICLCGIMAIVIFGSYGPGYDPAPFIYFQF